jgi:2-polyprenyl-3-methyl-5-hydroxy-6-metoxy-1,4-benzoquinol methylase
MNKKEICNLCGSVDKAKVVSEVKKKPKLETDYGIPEGNYFRKICRCLNCGAYFNSYSANLLPDDFYNGFYNSSIDSGKLIERFKRIIALPIAESDNKQRVNRIINFISNKSKMELDTIESLDVGTGTGVFVHELKKYLKNVNCVDPDSHSIELVKELIDVKNAWVGTVENIPNEKRFDFISFNKVLEHVDHPIKLLNEATSYLNQNGIIYIELPYSDLIIDEEKQEERAEFFVEHLVIYNQPSIEYLIKEAGLTNLLTEVIIEPSGKHTIFAFCKKNNTNL